MNKSLLLLIAAALGGLALAGCQPEKLASDSGSPDKARFQLEAIAGGDFVRLNNETGELHLIKSDGLLRLDEGTPAIEVGAYYRLPDAKEGDPQFLKYIGNGKFEPSIFAVVREAGTPTGEN